MWYVVKTPWWLKKLYPTLTWQMPSNEKVLYLTFDDGPNEKVTPFVLNQLKEFDAKATFFCIGKNVVCNPDICREIIDAGHSIGNHTFDHLNGWKTNDKTYVDNILKARKYIDSNLFRPPYGRITKFQAKVLQDEKENQARNFKVIMWTVLSGDFDLKISPQKCLDNVLKNSSEGSIIVFHDSTKAYANMSFALPKALEHFGKKGFRFEKLPVSYKL